jgi:hypothetical protein
MNVTGHTYMTVNFCVSVSEQVSCDYTSYFLVTQSVCKSNTFVKCLMDFFKCNLLVSI